MPIPDLLYMEYNLEGAAEKYLFVTGRLISLRNLIIIIIAEPIRLKINYLCYFQEPGEYESIT